MATCKGSQLTHRLISLGLRCCRICFFRLFPMNPDESQCRAYALLPHFVAWSILTSFALYLAALSGLVNVSVRRPYVIKGIKRVFVIYRVGKRYVAVLWIPFSGFTSSPGLIPLSLPLLMFENTSYEKIVPVGKPQSTVAIPIHYTYGVTVAFSAYNRGQTYLQNY